MTCNASWTDTGGNWNTDNPPANQFEPIPTWDTAGCLVAVALETFVIRDETVGAGFLWEGAVEEFSQFTDDAVHPFVGLWDTCEPEVDDDFWTEEEPFTGTAGECNE